MTHWCRDLARDEAVRASEDGRSGPLPTLEEAIAAVTERRPVPPGGGGNVTGGLRTERITLEITHDLDALLGDWIVQVIDESLGLNESVRIVDEAATFSAACPIAGGTVKVNGQDMVTLTEFLRHTTKLTQEAGVAKRDRDEAIRERDELKARVDYLERDRKFWCLQSGAHEQAANVLRARVAELESAAKLAPAANADGKSNHAAPAASGAAGTEPDYYVVTNDLGMVVHISKTAMKDGWAGCTITPLYAAPHAAKGWLTAKERGIIELARNHFYETCEHPDDLEVATLDALLARSSPPEVVHPECVFDEFSGCSAVHAWNICAADFRKALAAAGVKVKEVARDPS